MFPYQGVLFLTFKVLFIFDWNFYTFFGFNKDGEVSAVSVLVFLALTFCTGRKSRSLVLEGLPQSRCQFPSVTPFYDKLHVYRKKVLLKGTDL